LILIPPPRGLGRDTARRREAREALARVIWDPRGQRRLPSERALAAAMSACDRRDVWWVCEASSAGPVYLLPTREWIRALARVIDGLDVKSVLEIAAGDGFLSSCLGRERPKLVVRATDDGSWSRPTARMTAQERETMSDVHGIAMPSSVLRQAASTAVRAMRPDLVLVSWAPPGLLVERAIRGPTRYVLDIGVDGDVCGNGERTWRFEKDFLDGPIEARALCRLDARPLVEPRKTRVTLYYGSIGRSSA